MSSNKKTFSPRKIIVVIASVILALSLAYLAYYIIQEQKAAKLEDELAKRHSETVIITQETTAAETEATTEATQKPQLLLPSLLLCSIPCRAL